MQLDRMVDAVIYQIAQVMCRTVLGIFFPVRVSGTRSLLPTGRLLIIANHQSYLDPVLIGVAMPRPIHYLARSTLYRNKLFGRLIKALNAVKIERDGNATSGVRAALTCLQNEKTLVLWPEGTRSVDGKVGELKPGFLLLARKAQAPIIIAGIAGAFESWPRHQVLPKRAPIWMHFERWQGDPNSSTEEVLAGLQEALVSVQAEAVKRRRRAYGR